MNPLARCFALLLLSPAVTYGHGTETVGMFFGSMASLFIVIAGLVIVPFRRARRGIVFVTGHFKTSQSGSNQNQPPERGRDGESLEQRGQV